jgi:hypothetical protein
VPSQGRLQAFTDNPENGVRDSTSIDANGRQTLEKALRVDRLKANDLPTRSDGAQERTVRVPFYYDHRWHHVAVMLADEALELFVNGYLEGEATGIPIISSPPVSFRFGAGRGLEGEAGEFFEGLLDDVWIYRGSLSKLSVVP